LFGTGTPTLVNHILCLSNAKKQCSQREYVLFLCTSLGYGTQSWPTRAEVKHDLDRTLCSRHRPQGQQCKVITDHPVIKHPYPYKLRPGNFLISSNILISSSKFKCCHSLISKPGIFKISFKLKFDKYSRTKNQVTKTSSKR